MMWMFARTPPSYRPTSAVNRCGPWIPGSRVMWSVFPASWQLDFPFVPAVSSPTSTSELKSGAKLCKHILYGCSYEAHIGIFTKSVRCIAYNSPGDGSSLPVSFRTHTPYRSSLPMEGAGEGRGQYHPVIMLRWDAFHTKMIKKEYALKCFLMYVFTF